MAEIVEVIHKINYEVNDAGLQRATYLVHDQIAELKHLGDTLADYKRQLNTVKDLSAFDQLSRKIDTTGRQIEISLNKTRGILERFGSGLVAGLGLNTDLEGAVAKWIKPLSDHLLNIKREGAESGISISAIGRGLLSFSNIAPLAISLFTSLATKLTKTGKAARYSKQEIDEYTTAIINQVRANQEATQLEGNRRDIGANAARRKLELLRAQGASEKEILNAQLAYNNAVKRGYENERDAYDVIISESRRYIDFFGIDAKGENKELIASISKTMKEVLHITKEAADKEAAAWVQASNTRDSLLKKMLTQRTIANEKVKDLDNDNLVAQAEYERRMRERSLNEEQKHADKVKQVRKEKSDKDNKMESLPSLPYQKLPAIDTSNTHGTVSLPGNIADEKEVSDKRLEYINQTIAAYQMLSDAAVQAFQTIYDAQLKALDKEIDIRQKRVDAATRLAERGNTEVLKLEQEKLEAAQKQREEYARRQQVVNSALAISNAVVAVAQAAGQSGAGAIVIVPAVIAAIIAGYAAISAATKESTAQAFADGVVNYRGKGGPRDDANWVRISAGESIITAAGTTANHSILEAINNGVQFKLLDMPMLKSPGTMQSANGDSSKQSIKALEKKLDGVIAAIEDNRMKQNIYFNEQGVGIMTQKAIKRDQNRYR